MTLQLYNWHWVSFRFHINLPGLVMMIPLGLPHPITQDAYSHIFEGLVVGIPEPKNGFRILEKGHWHPGWGVVPNDTCMFTKIYDTNLTNTFG